MSGRDTIFALSSGTLPSGVAVVRLSGPGTRNVLVKMTGDLPAARTARLTNICNEAGKLLDRGLCIFFPGPTSFTGEDCGELHLHGGRAVVNSVLESLSAFPSMRAAEAGEFTKRAFLNGKIDLTGAEALSDLIAAETEAQRRFALANAGDRHRELYDSWRQVLLQARAMIEAELDFSDESDVPGSVADIVWRDVKTLRDAIAEHLARYRNAEIIRDGFKVVILGAPNAGKSSLLNALAQRDVAIVTDEPGTTRDLLEVSLDISGMKVTVTDTAGIRVAEGRVESIGIERALQSARESDLVVLLEDMTAPQAILSPDGIRTIKVGNKADLTHADDDRNYDCVISAKTGDGLNELLQIIKEATTAFEHTTGEVLPFRVRHAALLADAVRALDTAMSWDIDDLELKAEQLRMASNTLGKICGEIDVEDLLDTIFSTFCIGK